MICPNCNIGIRFEIAGTSQIYDDEQNGKQHDFEIAHGFCPECSCLIVTIRRGRYFQGDPNNPRTRELTPSEIEVIYPQIHTPRKVESEVPEHYKTDFLEACAVMPISSKASAAINRRLLQQVLREEFGIKRKTLAEEIDDFIGKPGVPSHLSQAIDAIRNIGNFAAHPLKNTHTGEVLDVEPGEAEWLIEVIESLFDFIFVQPKRLAQRKAALDSKLASVGKPPMK